MTFLIFMLYLFPKDAWVANFGEIMVKEGVGTPFFFEIYMIGSYYRVFSLYSKNK